MKSEKIDLKKLPVSQRLKFSEDLGSEVGKIINQALKKSNKKLEKYGYSVSVVMQFHEVEQKGSN